MDYQEIIAGTVGKENTYGTIVGRIAPGRSPIAACPPTILPARCAPTLAKARFTDDKLDTFGGYGTFRVDRLQELLQFICRNGFEHHVAATKSSVGDAVYDALSNIPEVGRVSATRDSASFDP